MKCKKKNKILCQTVFSKLELSDVPQELKTWSKLQFALISQQLIFEKISIMSKKKCQKLEEIYVILQLICKTFAILCQGTLILQE